jgi:hypothetical protein
MKKKELDTRDSAKFVRAFRKIAPELIELLHLWCKAMGVKEAKKFKSVRGEK